MVDFSQLPLTIGPEASRETFAAYFSEFLSFEMLSLVTAFMSEQPSFTPSVFKCKRAAKGSDGLYMDYTYYWLIYEG